MGRGHIALSPQEAPHPQSTPSAQGSRGSPSRADPGQRGHHEGQAGAAHRRHRPTGLGSLPPRTPPASSVGSRVPAGHMPAICSPCHSILSGPQAACWRGWGACELELAPTATASKPLRELPGGTPAPLGGGGEAGPRPPVAQAKRVRAAEQLARGHAACRADRRLEAGLWGDNGPCWTLGVFKA